MTRKRKLLLNTISSLIYEFLTIICGFILPRMFLKYYGSEVNGLIVSISQFLGFISLMECGIGAVIESSLYKPLAKKDDKEISMVFVSSKNFFRKISYILVLYTLVLIVCYPLFLNSSFSNNYVIGLIIILAISLFIQYYYSMIYTLLLNANSKAYVPLFIKIISLILNLVISIILIKNNFSIHLVKFVSSLIFLIQPIFLILYVNKNYNINKKIKIVGEPIKQKWNGLTQHIAAVVLGNTDVVLLTLFSTLNNVSIYSVYYMVVVGVKQIVLSFSTGMKALFGEMYAKKEKQNLNNTFSYMEWLIHSVTTFLFTCTGILILSFIKIYTGVVSDINYIQPIFSIFIVLAYAVYCIRLPYISMVYAAGHYKETQWSALIEPIINITISIILVKKFGLVGVAIGTLCAMLYRTLYLVYYLSKNIINRKPKYFIKNIIVDFISVFLILILSLFVKLKVNNYLDWVLYAILISLISCIIMIIVNTIFYPKFIDTIFNKLKQILKNKRRINNE